MKKKKLILLALPLLLFASCSQQKPYTGYIRDNVGAITDTVLNVKRSNDASAGEYTIICIHFSKYFSEAKDVTLSISDIKAYTNGKEVNTITFGGGVGHHDTTTEKFYYLTSPTTTFTIKIGEVYYPDCYVAFEVNSITKNSTIKVKGQEVNHDENSPSQLDL